MDLAALAAPMSREEAFRTGALVDVSTGASWLGFAIPCAVTAGVWQEIAGAASSVATRAETLAAAAALRQLWTDLAALVQIARVNGQSLRVIRFHVRSAAGRSIPVVAVCQREGGVVCLTIHLAGEC